MKEELKEKRGKITPRTSHNSGITLVALIITIIVLLILAVVAIRAVQGDGIIWYAKNAQTRYEQEQAKEQDILESYIGTIEPEKAATTIEEAQSGAMLSKTVNSTVTDKYGNKIVVPAGFKILVDSTTDYTKEDIDVTKGIVIQDGNGNEFVWIPVGDVYTTEDTEKTESNTTKIELKRYVFNDDGTINESLTQTEPGAQLKPKFKTSSLSWNTTISWYCTEGLKDSTTSNAHAKDIVAFKTSAETNHGYYIGRFEAGVSGYDETATNSNRQPSGETNWTKYTTADGKDPQLVCKANQQVWYYVTQKKASELCQNMYTSKPYESDLINSYAWDTAIVFIQTFGTETDASTYSIENKPKTEDKYRNIYNMSGNAWEWTTETSSSNESPCTSRGGRIALEFASSGSIYLIEKFYDCTSYRDICKTTSCKIVESNAHEYPSFRPLLYV